MFKELLVLNFAATWFMVGLIWMVQVVHYPLFARVGLAQFAAFEAEHTRLISLVVGPMMLIELLSALALIALWPSRLPTWVGWLAVGLLVVIWLTTLLVSVPLHRKLAAGFDAEAHSALVATNWVRTLAWSARGLLMVWILLKTV